MKGLIDMPEEILMPNSFSIERSLLGSFLIYHDIYLKYSNKVDPAYFYFSPFKTIFEYMLQSNCTSPRLLKEKFPALAENISDAVGSNDGQIEYETEIEILRDRWERRRLIEISKQAIQAAAEDFERPGSAIIESTMTEINRDYSATGTPEHIRTILPRVVEGLYAQITGEVKGRATGLPDVDDILGCFMPGELSIIAARPSMGKTSFVNDIILYEAVKRENPVLFFSLEMSKEQIVGRMLFTESGASYGNALTGSKRDLDKAKENIEKVAAANIYIDDSTNINTSHIYTKTEAWIKKHGIKIVFIDHRGYIKPLQRARSTHEEVSEISKGLVGIARKFNIPVVLVSQLSRNVESRRPPVPLLSDLRESGSLEEDARKVIFLYRDDYYNKNSEKKGMVDIIIAKNHNGKTGTVELIFEIENMKFKCKAKEGPYDSFGHD